MKSLVAALSVMVCVPVLGLVVSSCGHTPTAPDSAASGAVTTGAVTLDAKGGQPKVDLCHFDETAGRWVMISVAEPAVRAHLTNHDDAKPGGTTSVTHTMLDENCEPVLCPCYDTADVVALFQPGMLTRGLTCEYSSSSTFIHDLPPWNGRVWLVESYVNWGGNPPTDYYTCEKTLMSGPPDPNELPIPRTTISYAEHLVCVEVIHAAQVELNCPY